MTMYFYKVCIGENSGLVFSFLLDYICIGFSVELPSSCSSQDSRILDCYHYLQGFNMTTEAWIE